MDERQEYNLKLPTMCTIAEEVPELLLPRLLQSVEKLHEPYNKAQLLCSMVQQNTKLLSPILKLTKEIEDEFYYSSIFIQLVGQFPDFFQIALDATKRIPFEHNRAGNFARLAGVTPSALFSNLLTAVSEMTDERSIAMFFYSAEHYIPNNHLEEALIIIERIQMNQHKAGAFSGYLHRLPLDRLLYVDLRHYLHLLAYCRRASLMQDLAILYPTISHLGGEIAVYGVVDAMREVCSQWK